jgi:FMN phosphatase YigB (HAD superfamily)
MQKNKIRSLGLDSLFDTIIYCWEYKYPKPSLIGFKIASEKMNIDIEHCLIVGDHPKKDIVSDRQFNAKEYRTKTQRFSHLASNKDFPPPNLIIV